MRNFETFLVATLVALVLMFSFSEGGRQPRATAMLNTSKNGILLAPVLFDKEKINFIIEQCPEIAVVVALYCQECGDSLRPQFIQLLILVLDMFGEDAIQVGLLDVEPHSDLLLGDFLWSIGEHSAIAVLDSSSGSSERTATIVPQSLWCGTTGMNTDASTVLEDLRMFRNWFQDRYRVAITFILTTSKSDQVSPMEIRWAHARGNFQLLTLGGLEGDGGLSLPLPLVLSNADDNIVQHTTAGHLFTLHSWTNKSDSRSSSSDTYSNTNTTAREMDFIPAEKAPPPHKESAPHQFPALESIRAHYLVPAISASSLTVSISDILSKNRGWQQQQHQQQQKQRKKKAAADEEEEEENKQHEKDGAYSAHCILIDERLDSDSCSRSIITCNQAGDNSTTPCNSKYQVSNEAERDYLFSYWRKMRGSQIWVNSWIMPPLISNYCKGCSHNTTAAATAAATTTTTTTLTATNHTERGEECSHYEDRSPSSSSSFSSASSLYRKFNIPFPLQNDIISFYRAARVSVQRGETGKGWPEPLISTVFNQLETSTYYYPLPSVHLSTLSDIVVREIADWLLEANSSDCVELEVTGSYGIREYRKGAIINWHTDPLRAQPWTAIIHIDHGGVTEEEKEEEVEEKERDKEEIVSAAEAETDTDWTFDISTIDFEIAMEHFYKQSTDAPSKFMGRDERKEGGKEESKDLMSPYIEHVVLRPGQGIIIESGRVAHGRTERLRKLWYGNAFVHVAPVGWQAAVDDVL